MWLSVHPEQGRSERGLPFSSLCLCASERHKCARLAPTTWGRRQVEAAVHLNSGLLDFGQLPSSSKGFMALSEDRVTGTPPPKGSPEAGQH